MDKREILQQIIDNNGSCDWIGYGDGIEGGQAPACQFCPLGKLKQRQDGTFTSCFEAVVFDSPAFSGTNTGVRFVDHDKLYLNKATEILQDILIEDMLTGEIETREK